MKIKRLISMLLAVVLTLSLVVGAIPTVQAADSFTVKTTKARSTLPFNTYEFYMLMLTNKERLAEGLYPLTSIDTLQAACDIRSEEIAESFSHTRPDGTSCFTALDETGAIYDWAGENIAYGYSTPASVVNAWMNSEGHRANIMDTSYSHIGVGFYDYNWVQMFTGRYTESYTEAYVYIPDSVMAGTEVEDMFMYAELENDYYETCYLPISSEFVSGYDPGTIGTQEITLDFLGFYGTVSLTVVKNTAISITSQPTTQKVKAGTTAKFTVAASGSGLSYQWEYKTPTSDSWKNATATGNKTKTLSVSATTGKSNYQYRCKVTDSSGNVAYSNIARLYVLGIKTQPVSAKEKVGATATFTVDATGHNKTYQWQYRTSSSGTWYSSTATGNKTATLSVPVTASRHGYQYRCKVTDSKGNVVYSNAATLYVLRITGNPSTTTVTAGSNATFKVSATGHNKTYQWQYRTSSSGNWQNATATGNKTATLTVPGATYRNGYQYRCKVTDSKGNVVYSKAATLYVTGIKTQPADAAIAVGENATFTVAATGNNLSYQWQYRTSASGKWYSSDAVGSNTATLTIPGTSFRNGYQYRCKITDGAGNVVYSDAATLTVS